MNVYKKKFDGERSSSIFLLHFHSLIIESEYEDYGNPIAKNMHSSLKKVYEVTEIPIDNLP